MQQGNMLIDRCSRLCTAVAIHAFEVKSGDLFLAEGAFERGAAIHRFACVIFDEGIGEMKRSQELDPVSTLSLGGMGHAYLIMRRYDEAIPNFQKVLDLYPNAAFIRAQLAWSYAMKGMYPQALAEYDKIAEPDKAVAAENQLVADGLGWVYAISGKRADALKIAKEVEELSSHAYVDFYQLATIYAGLGDKDEVFRLLEKGYQQRAAGILYLAVDPFWDGMRSDPRFTDLLRRMGLPQ
jgi:eukaryotic-like serine/threonine-protein kinase